MPGMLSAWHAVPKALHANMFVVRRAKEVMETDIAIIPPETSFDAFVRRPEHAGRMRHFLVAHDNRLFGVLRVNTALRGGLGAVESGTTMGELAQRNFVIAREEDVMFDVIARLWRKGAVVAVVVRGWGVPRPGTVVWHEPPVGCDADRHDREGAIRQAGIATKKYCGIILGP